VSSARRRATTVLTALTVGAALLLVMARIAGLQPLVEQSGSMRPAIAPGDLVIVRTVHADALAVGDVVSFHDDTRAGALITHRVTAVHRDGDLLAVATLGDANNAGEHWVAAPDAQLGRAVVVVPYTGAVLTALSAPLAAGCLLGILAVLAALAVTARIRRGRVAAGANWRPGPVSWRRDPPRGHAHR
jgi:signal peptidase I